MKLFNIKDFRKFSPIYIETGTCYGDGLNRALKAGFDVLKSVEADWTILSKCSKRFLDYLPSVKNGKCEPGKIHLCHGLSAEMLPLMLEDVKQPAVIFLDAHPAGPNTAGHDDLMEKGTESEYLQDKIITSELREILKHRADHIIIIDDQAGPNHENFKYMHQLLAANPTYEFEFYDEQLEDGILKKDKILVCIPKNWHIYCGY